MKKTFIKIMLVSVTAWSCTTMLSSCTKEGCTDEAATNYDADAEEDDGSCEYAQAATPANPQITPGDADAVFIALSTVSYTDAPFVGEIETVIGLPVAFALDGADMGTVTCEGETLEKSTNNTYLYSFEASNPLGLEYGSYITWTTSGSSAFPALNNEVFGTFPSTVAIDVETGGEVSTSGAFTLSLNSSVSSADSLIFAVHGPDASVVHTVSGSATSHTFTAAEMASVGTGFGFVQLTGYTIVSAAQLGDIKAYFINEKVNTVSVELK